MLSLRSSSSVLLIFGIIILTSITGSAQSFTVDNICLTAEETTLARQINRYRKDSRLPEIPLSKSLTVVAKTHIDDLQTHRPDTNICTAASWSEHGKWTPCCFNPYVLKYDCMWDKPKELTAYPYRGYELVYYDENIIQPDSLFAIFQSSSETMDMFLTKNMFHDKKWAAMGLAIGENYVSIWFGQRNDPAGTPKACREISGMGDTDQTQKDQSLPVVNNKPSIYHLIYGSFTTKADADEALRRFKNNGMEKASILAKDGRYRISLEQFNTLRNAMNAKEKLQNLYPEAWIFKE